MRQVLEDHERRVLAHLSIPRNVADLARELVGDPGAASFVTEGGTGKDLARALLPELEKAGLVVNLGEHKDLARLTSVVEKSKALTMPDDKAANFVARLSTKERRWRVQGNLYMLTDEAVALMHEPVDERPPMTIDEVERLLAAQGRLVVEPHFTGSIFDEDGGRMRPGDAATLSLAQGVALDEPIGNVTQLPRMLPEEFAHWAKLVSDDAEQRWGVRPQQPLAGGAGYFDATEDLIQAADAGGTAYSETSPTFMALSILAFTDADTGTTADNGSHIPTYTGYARKSATTADLGTSTNGTRTNANAITWAACTAGSSTILAFGRMVAATVGRAIRYGTTASTTISTTQTPATMAAAALTDTLD